MPRRSREELLREIETLRHRVGLLERAIAADAEGRGAAESQGEAASASLALLDTLFLTASVGLAFLDRELRYVRINPLLAAMNGHSVADHLGRTVGEMVPEMHPSPESICRRVLESGGACCGVEMSGSTTTGKPSRRRLAGYYPVRTAEAGIIGVTAMVLDVTDQQRAIEELASQRAFLRQVIDLDPNFVFAKDRQGRFTLVNQAVADAYGTTVDDLIGKTDADFNPSAEEVEHFRRDDLEVMDTRSDKLVPEEVITDAKGRTRILMTIKRAIVSPDGTANQVLGVSNDITARKQLEEQLSQAQKMEAVGRLAGGVAHDFNNLLTIILGSSELMLSALGPDDPLRPGAEEIREASQRAAMLTQRLLAFSRKQVLQPEVLDLSGVVRESVGMLRRLIGDDVDLVTLLSPQSSNVKADPGQLTQVFLNLAINARDAMPGGGTLTIKTASVTLDEAYAAGHPEASPGDYVMIAVSDTGRGIPPEVMPRIFEPFFTTKEPGQGTGLGLATAYGIVRQSGGHITVSSQPGRGTTFRVYLPRLEEAAVPGGPTRSGVALRGTETILLVEDEAAVRGVAVRGLRQHGYAVLEASGGSEALEVAARHAGPIDLLIADVVMPRMRGTELAAKLLRTRPATRVIYTSGYADPSSEIGGLVAEGAGFLPKPYRPGDLARLVREILDRPAA